MPEIGSTLTWTVLTRDTAGTLTDATSPVATVTLPDGASKTSTADPSVVAITKTATGTYLATCVSSLPGRYRLRVTGTGVASLPYSDVADVWPSDPRFIVSLADVRAEVNARPGYRAEDDEIRSYIATTTAVIEDIVGPVLVASQVLEVSGQWRQCIPLPVYHATVASVVEDGRTLTAGSDYCLDEYGLLWRGAYPHAAGYWSNAGARNVTITYSVGATIIPAHILEAAKKMVRHLIGQSASPRTFGPGGEQMGTTPSGWAVPNAVLELLRPSAGNKVAGMA